MLPRRIGWGAFIAYLFGFFYLGFAVYEFIYADAVAALLWAACVPVWWFFTAPSFKGMRDDRDAER